MDISRASHIVDHEHYHSLIARSLIKVTLHFNHTVHTPVSRLHTTYSSMYHSITICQNIVSLPFSLLSLSSVVHIRVSSLTTPFAYTRIRISNFDIRFDLSGLPGDVTDSRSVPASTTLQAEKSSLITFVFSIRIFCLLIRFWLRLGDRTGVCYSTSICGHPQSAARDCSDRT